MNGNDIKNKLLEIITQIVEIDGTVIEEKADANLYEAFELLSITALEIVFAIEEEFKIKIEDGDIKKLDTFNNLLNFVVEKVNMATV